LFIFPFNLSSYHHHCIFTHTEWWSLKSNPIFHYSFVTICVCKSWLMCKIPFKCFHCGNERKEEICFVVTSEWRYERNFWHNTQCSCVLNKWPWWIIMRNFMRKEINHW
jgi:hypothetical protein